MKIYKNNKNFIKKVIKNLLKIIKNLLNYKKFITVIKNILLKKFHNYKNYKSYKNYQKVIKKLSKNDQNLCQRGPNFCQRSKKHQKRQFMILATVFKIGDKKKLFNFF